MTDQQYYEEIIRQQKITNSLLNQLLEVMSKSIDIALGADTLNKDFLEDEVRKSFITG